MADVVRFRVGGDPAQVVPEVNGLSLVSLVSAFEESQEYRPTGGYAGIIPEHFNLGDLTAYLLGRDNGQWPRPGHIWLLGCDCGEIGCWPLEAKIDSNANLVVWTAFKQPHRPTWDYQGFGPYVFERDQYEQAVADAAVALATS